jgi:hypothetical protein
VGQGYPAGDRDGWIAQVKDKGLDGAKLLEQAKALVANYDKA